MTPDVIQVNHVSKMFTVHKAKSLKDHLVNIAKRDKRSSEYWALQDVNLSVKAGESLGVAGPNGSGKSTLLKAIGGIIAPNKGEIRTRGRLAALLELGAGFHPDLTGRENIFLNGSIMGLPESEIKRHLDDIIDFSGIPDFIDTQVKFYSSGMYVRLAFAVAVHSDPDILLVDEVLAVGDELFQRKCLEKIKEFQREGRSIILVSHSADQILNVCDRAVILNQGKLVKEGEVADAMAFLHQNYRDQLISEDATPAEKISSSPSAPDISAATSSANMWIKNIHILGDAEEVLSGFSTMTSGGNLVAQINVVTDAPITGYYVQMIFSNMQGEKVCTIDSSQADIRFPQINGRWRFLVTIPHFQLGAGDYSVGVVLRTLDGRILEERKKAVMLSIQPQRKSVTGYVNAQFDIAMEEWD